MKIPKTQIVVRAWKETADWNRDYSHWVFDFIRLEYWVNGKEIVQSHKELMTVRIQMDREKGFSLYKAYAPYAERVSLDGGLKDVKKILGKMGEGINHWAWRGVVSFVKQYPRYVYATNDSSCIGRYIPRAWEKDPNTWLNAMEKGYQLTK